jgi:SAM-dependent methyltransferase
MKNIVGLCELVKLKIFWEIIKGLSMLRFFLNNLYFAFGHVSYIHLLIRHLFAKSTCRNVFELGCGNGNVALVVVASGAKKYVGFDARGALSRSLIWRFLTFFNLAVFENYNFFVNKKNDGEKLTYYKDYYFVSTGVIQALPQEHLDDFLEVANKFMSGFISYPHLTEIRGDLSRPIAVEGCIEFPVDVNRIREKIPLAKIFHVDDMNFIVW